MADAGLFFAAAQAVLLGPEDRLLNIQRFDHQDLLRGLHALVHGPRSILYQRRCLRLGYGDGSESAPFPIPAQPWVLPEESELQRSPLRLGFLSGRHPELDREVDFYLIRNREIEQYDHSADQEQEIYERTRCLFQDPAFAEPWRVEVYHTGLEDVTVGFYRAVVDLARERRTQHLPTIPLIPRLWRRGELNVDLIIRQAHGVLDGKVIRPQLAELVAAYPDFLDFSNARLRWRLERRMDEAERNLLCERAPAARVIFQRLWQLTQYQDEQTWGL